MITSRSESGASALSNVKSPFRFFRIDIVFFCCVTCAAQRSLASGKINDSNYNGAVFVERDIVTSLGQEVW